MRLVLLTQQKGNYIKPQQANPVGSNQVNHLGDSNEITPESTTLRELSPVTTTGLSTTGNRSCGLVQYFSDMRKANPVNMIQIEIQDAMVCTLPNGIAALASKSNALKPIPLSSIDGVMKRSWDGGLNKNLGMQLQSQLENHGIYSDNHSAAQAVSNSKIDTYRALTDPKTNHGNLVDCVPKTFIFPAADKLSSLPKAIADLLAHAEENEYLDINKDPVMVLKFDEGTHGNAVSFFKANELDKLISEVKDNPFKPFVLQAYVRPKVFQPIDDEKPFSSHYRIIVSNKGTDAMPNYQIIGGIHFQRNGAWCSNSHGTQGTLYKEPLGEIPSELRSALFQAGKALGLNQFGADVIIDEGGQAYILELNDGMGISGPILEEQGVAQQYVESFIQRAGDWQKSHFARTG